MPVHVQLTRSKYIMTNGVMRPYTPGDWVMVGSQTARDWIAAGDAIDPFAQMKHIDAPQGEVGIMLFGSGAKPDLQVPTLRESVWEMRWQQTLFYDTAATVRVELIPAGFRMLKHWQMAVPLLDYRKLARDVGTPEEQKDAEKVLHDLRVPLYDTRLIFARRCTEVETLLELWQGAGGGPLAFLVALYKVKPLLRALPVTWTGQWAPTDA